jgi:forkhead transcription factor HCM1
MHRPRPQLQPSAIPLQPLSNPSAQPGVILVPPMSAPQQPSPLKAQLVASPPKPNYNHVNFVSIPPPVPTNVFTDSPVKRAPLPTGRPYCLEGGRQPLFTTFNSNLDTFEQETYRPPAPRNENFADFPEPAYVRKQHLKRSYSDVAPMTERPFKKPRAEEMTASTIPEPEDMPPIEDDKGKPSLSYAQMIGMAILRAPNRRLTLSQIYDWISNTFAFYREDTKQGWHNSIRHNLSLNKAFKKQERPKGDAGKGSYWVIEPGMEAMFIKDKPRKGATVANISVQPQFMRSDSQPIAQPLAEALAPNPWLGQTKTSSRPQTAPALPELSSDATLPASDPALDEDDDVAEFGITALSQAPHSSPPQAMNSSPPVAALSHRRSGSSPARQTLSALNRKGNATTMDDSGYFSSLESSAFRPNKSGVVLTSEIDLEPPRMKRGRAEEEILRIRSSSITPSHRRFRSLGSEDILSSSPTRPTSVKLNPVTPSIFKKPRIPPPSISPNTQLRNHRKALQEFTNSPIKSLGLWGADFDTYSPAFKFPGSATHNSFDEHFEVFTDAVNTNPTTPALGSSPLKQSAKRPSLSRASATANILSDITGSNGRFTAKTPSKGPLLLKPTPKILLSGSPLKGSSINPAIFEDQEDLFDFGFFTDENSDSGEGVDILKGFQKIGGTANKPTTPPATNATRKAMRPGHSARSFTSRF